MDMETDERTSGPGAASFDAFFRAEHRRLAALATALCGDRELGRDVAQEALTRAFRDWDRVGRLQQPGGWTRRVVVNLVRDHGRHLAVRDRRLPELARRIAGDQATDGAAVDAEMWAAVAMLPERQRTAVALFYIGDRSISDVAQVMGVREGTVKTTLHQARAQLRQMLMKEES
jgi:RNA polymerase sigma-70 factor (ECF subfamily)